MLARSITTREYKIAISLIVCTSLLGIELLSESKMLATRTIIRSHSSSSVSATRSAAYYNCQRKSKVHGLRPNTACRNHHAIHQTRRRRFSTAAEAAVVEEPNYSTLKIIALGQAIPFIGFGFMDNAILIVAGDAIDT